MRTHLAIALCAAGLTVAACSSSGGSSSPAPTSSGLGTSSPAAQTTPSSAAARTTPSSANNAPATSGGIALSGDFTGTVTAALCTGGIASIEVKLNGDSETYRGSISATSFGFVGPAAADYSLKQGQAKPVASADGMSFTVKDATLIDLVSSKSVTATGTATCP